MPKITIEKNIEVAKNLFEVRSTTYNIPEQIVYNGKVLHYDRYHMSYVSDELWLSAVDYIKEQLEQTNKKDKGIEQ